MPRVGGHPEDAEALLLHRHTWCALTRADKERAGHVNAQKAILTEDRHADFERLQLAAAGIQQRHREEHFTLDLIDGCHVQFLDKPPQPLGRRVALHANGPAFPAIGILQGNILVSVVLGEAMQTVSDDELQRLLVFVLLKNHHMSIQMPKVVRLAGMFERLPLGDSVHLKFCH